MKILDQICQITFANITVVTFASKNIILLVFQLKLIRTKCQKFISRTTRDLRIIQLELQVDNKRTLTMKRKLKTRENYSFNFSSQDLVHHCIATAM